MLKEKYIEFEKKQLLKFAFSPYELTDKGLKNLRKNIVIHIISTMSFITAILLGLNHFPNLSFSTLSSPFVLVAVVAVICVSLKFITISSEYLTETGLWWRISVSDDLQDEWELAMKHKAQSAAFEYSYIFIWSAVIIWGVTCFVSYITTRSMPPMPPMSVVFWCVFCLAYIMILLPLVFIAWTLDPIQSDGEDLYFVESGDGIPLESVGKTAPTKPQGKWVRYSLNIAPYVLGGTIGILFFSHEGTVFYDVGYKLGRWIGGLFKAG